MRTRTTLLVITLFGAFLCGPIVSAPLRLQSPTQKVSFEVASIKPNNSSTPPSMWGLAAVSSGAPAIGCRGTDRGNRNVPIGRCVFKNVTAGALISIFFNQSSDKIAPGLPEWATSDAFDVEAKAADPTTTAELVQMMQSLLIDRFKLQFHNEVRRVSGFRLLVEAKGTHVSQSIPGQTNTGIFGVFSKGVLDGRAASMEQLSEFLARGLNAPVSNSTSLTGNFDFTLRWMPDDLADPGGLPETQRSSLFTALQEQLGLRLESQKLNVEMFVVDHLEKPTLN